MSGNLHSLGLGNGFSAVTPKALATKGKHKLDFKNKNFCASKDTTEKVRRQPMEQEQ